MITLGINYSQMHDSSAGIVRDGELLFAVAEERLSRVKHDARFPHLAIKASLDAAGLKAGEVHYVCLGWSQQHTVFVSDVKNFLGGKHPLSYLNVLNSTKHFVSMWHQGGGLNRFTHHFGPTKARTRFVDHHLAHAISAFAFSGFSEAAVLVLDGRGAWEATSIWYGRDGRLDHVLTVPWPNSLGLFYAAFTEHLGFQAYSDEWKVMGLAPYGQPRADLGDFIALGHGLYRVNARDLLGRGNGHLSAIERQLGPRRPPERGIESRSTDVAFDVHDA